MVEYGLGAFASKCGRVLLCGIPEAKGIPASMEKFPSTSDCDGCTRYSAGECRAGSSLH